MALALLAFGCSSSSESPPVMNDGAVEDVSPDGFAEETGADATADTADASEPEADAATDSGADVDASPDGTHVCNSLVLTGELVPRVRVAEDPPTLAGGTITPGTYVLTGLVQYTGPGGPTDTGTPMRATLVLESDGTFASKTARPSYEYSATGTYVVDGASVRLGENCPGAAEASMAYEATETTLKLLESAASGHLELTYQRE